MPYLMAGSMVLGGVMGGISGGDEAAAKYAAEVAQYNDRTIRDAFNSGKQIFGVANANAMKRLQNQMNAEQMARNYARQRLDLQKTTSDRRRFMSENQRLTEASTNAMVTAKLGTGSGTAERIREQMKHKGAKNWETEFFNNLDAEKAIKQQYRNNLNQIDDSMQQADAYIPGMKPQAPDMGGAILNGVMQGVMGGGALGANLGTLFGSGAPEGGGGLGPLGTAATSDSTGSNYMSALGFGG